MKTGCDFLKRTVLTLVVALLVIAAPMTGFAENRFLSAIDDLPLMKGLHEVEGSVVDFNSPGGRIVETLTMGKVNRDAILQFYSETLPQLGWTEIAPGNFSREGELLKLEFPPTLPISGAPASGETPVTSVQFLLSPAN